MRLIRLIRVEIQGIPRKGLIRLIRSGKSRNYGNQGVDSIAGGTARISETRELTQSQGESREFRKPGSSLNRRGNRENFGNQGVHSFLLRPNQPNQANQPNQSVSVNLLKIETESTEPDESTESESFWEIVESSKPHPGDDSFI